LAGHVFKAQGYLVYSRKESARKELSEALRASRAFVWIRGPSERETKAMTRLLAEQDAELLIKVRNWLGWRPVKEKELLHMLMHLAPPNSQEVAYRASNEWIKSRG